PTTRSTNRTTCCCRRFCEWNTAWPPSSRALSTFLRGRAKRCAMYRAATVGGEVPRSRELHARFTRSGDIHCARRVDHPATEQLGGAATPMTKGGAFQRGTAAVSVRTE